MNKASFDNVNPHYLENVMKASDKHEVVAGEDIHNSAGLKLVAKGQRIDEDMRDRLVQFKLRQPIECSLSVKAGIGTTEILAQAEAYLDKVKPLSALFQSKTSVRRALSTIKELHLDQMATLLLSMQSGLGTLPHSVLVSLFALALCIDSGLSDSVLIEAALAGLLHDVGELYINPEYLRSDRKLMPEEWKHIVVHPHIGQIVVGEVAEWPNSIAMAIGEHHERANGFGYPRQLTGDSISALGKVLLTCEAICGLLTKEEHPVQRACLAAKLIPGEYPFEMVSLITSLPCDEEPPDQTPIPTSRVAELIERTERMAGAIDTALGNIEQLQAITGWSASSTAFLDHTHKRLLMLRGVMYHTGLSPCYQQLGNIKDKEAIAGIYLEAEVVSHEIAWRLNEVSRHIILMNASLEEDLQACLSEKVLPYLVLK